MTLITIDSSKQKMAIVAERVSCLEMLPSGTTMKIYVDGTAAYLEFPTTKQADDAYDYIKKELQNCNESYLFQAAN